MSVTCWIKMLLLGLLAFLSMYAYADELTPNENLVGISKVHEKLSVSLNLKGADEFRVDTEKVKSIVKEALKSAGVATNGSGIGMPMVSATISGESTGGGGARYTVELVVRANISSPFAKNRSVDAIFWFGAASASEAMRYDPASEGFVKPSGPINERVYASVREVASRLAADFKRANAN